MGEMTGGSNSLLIIECRMALGLSQKQLGDLVGCAKRTIQRWEDRGAILIPSEVEPLVRALCSVRLDLAERLATSIGTSLEALGIDASLASPAPASFDPIDSVVRVATEAVGVTPDAIRPALTAAFVRAAELGLDVQAVARALSQRDKP
jgi:transcriptional regulator with XRE-family HTH domain